MHLTDRTCNFILHTYEYNGELLADQGVQNRRFLLYYEQVSVEAASQLGRKWLSIIPLNS